MRTDSGLAVLSRQQWKPFHGRTSELTSERDGHKGDGTRLLASLQNEEAPAWPGGMSHPLIPRTLLLLMQKSIASASVVESKGIAGLYRTCTIVDCAMHCAIANVSDLYESAGKHASPSPNSITLVDRPASCSLRLGSHAIGHCIS